MVSRSSGHARERRADLEGPHSGVLAPIHPGGAKIDPESIHKAIDGSLQRLQADYLDLWMFHRDDPEHPVGPLVDALDEEVRAGRIRAYGGSNWTTSRI